MTLLEKTRTGGQESVSTHRRLPVDDGTTANVQSVSGETVQFFYYNASTGVLTQDAGQAAGTVVVANLTNKNILNALGDMVGVYGDTSFAFTTGTILTTLRPFNSVAAEQAELNGLDTLKAGQNRAIAVTSGFAIGEYCIDHEHWVIYGKKATTGTSDTGAYKVLSPGGGGSVAENVNVAKVGGTTTATGSGTVNAGTQRMTLATDVLLPAYAARSNSTSTAAENDRIVKASAGNIRAVSMTNANAATRFLQIHDSASEPADTAVPIASIPVPTGTTQSIDYGLDGRTMSTGIYICASTAQNQKILAGNDHLFDAQYT